MIVTKDINRVREHRRNQIAQSWGFVPTMGFLHEGHLSLMRKALEENDVCVVSIFVNPRQFNNPLDFENYPKARERDLAMLKEIGVALVFTPERDKIYPAGFSATVHLGKLAETLEGAARPGHFDGVCTVVTKLFNIVQPEKAYFGEKDAQQLLIIKEMVRDLNFPVQIIGCATCREQNGLAISSRNERLTSEQKAKATVLYKSLQLAQRMILQGERHPPTIVAAMKAVIQKEPAAKIDLLSINQAETLEEITEIKGNILISLAVFWGEVRLIDNIKLSV